MKHSTTFRWGRDPTYQALPEDDDEGPPPVAGEETVESLEGPWIYEEALPSKEMERRGLKGKGRL